MTEMGLLKSEMRNERRVGLVLPMPMLLSSFLSLEDLHIHFCCLPFFSVSDFLIERRGGKVGNLKGKAEQECYITSGS